jgi:hypothetical protein
LRLSASSSALRRSAFFFSSIASCIFLVFFVGRNSKSALCIYYRTSLVKRTFREFVPHVHSSAGACARPGHASQTSVPSYMY